MPRASDAKSRFVETAVALFRERGYNGVGIAEIIEASGAPKGSFYHHFPGGKEELAEAAVRASAGQIERFVDRVLSESATFSAGCADIARRIGEHFEASGFREGCPVTAVAIDAVPGSARLTKVVDEVMESWVALAARHAERLGDPAGREKAERFFVAIEGAWVVSRMRRSAAPFGFAAEAAA